MPKIIHKDHQVVCTIAEAQEIFTAKQPIRRHPEQPVGFTALETQVMAASSPVMVPVERTLLRALVRYVRRLESVANDAGSFW